MKKTKTKEEWKDIVEKYDNSGLSASKFCDNNNIPKSTFQYWIKKYSKNHKLSVVKVTPNITAISATTRVTINNFILEIPNKTSVNKIAKLISIIREDI